MPIFREHFDDAASDAILTLDRLVRIGVRADTRDLRRRDVMPQRALTTSESVSQSDLITAFGFASSAVSSACSSAMVVGNGTSANPIRYRV